MIRLSATRKPEQDGGDRIVFTVEDTGIGMTPEQLDKVFEPFQQADSSTTRKYGGTGLGLAIAYGIISEHQGGIECQSTPGQGTTFHITLPVVEQEETTGIF